MSCVELLAFFPPCRNKFVLLLWGPDSSFGAFLVRPRAVKLTHVSVDGAGVRALTV